MSKDSYRGRMEVPSLNFLTRYDGKVGFKEAYNFSNILEREKEMRLFRRVLALQVPYSIMRN